MTADLLTTVRSAARDTYLEAGRVLDEVKPSILARLEAEARAMTISALVDLLAPERVHYGFQMPAQSGRSKEALVEVYVSRRFAGSPERQHVNGLAEGWRMQRRALASARQWVADGEALSVKFAEAVTEAEGIHALAYLVKWHNVAEAAYLARAGAGLLAAVERHVKDEDGEDLAVLLTALTQTHLTQALGLPSRVEATEIGEARAAAKVAKAFGAAATGSVADLIPYLF